ncbi:hypothetical protein QBC42DRAFT_151684, partial [Cladorrhinum samala]
GILLPNIHGIRFSSREEPAVPDLPVWADGKKYLFAGPDSGQYRHIRQTRHGIQMHCRDVYGWANGR